LTRPGLSRCSRCPHNHDIRSDIRSPLRLESVTPSLRPLPPDVLPTQTALVSWVPIKLFPMVAPPCGAVPCGFCARPDHLDIAYAIHLANPADFPSNPQSANEEPGHNTLRHSPSRRAHDIEAPMTSTQPGPLRRPKVSPRSQHRFGFRSPPQLKLATSSSRPLPPDALSIWPTLVFPVPIRSFSYGCSAVLCGWTSRSPAPRFMSLLRIYPSDPVPAIACMSKPPILFFPLGSMSRHRQPLSSGPRCRSGHHVCQGHSGLI